MPTVIYPVSEKLIKQILKITLTFLSKLAIFLYQFISILIIYTETEHELSLFNEKNFPIFFKNVPKLWHSKTDDLGQLDCLS